MIVSPPRLVIGAPQGRSGKTTIALGLCAALAGRGLAVQPFKKGPDYIDPSWLSEAAGRPCRSLDAFFLPDPHDLQTAFLKGAASGPRPADLCLVEGNHGLYDTQEGEGRGSTADLARILGAPILLVVNAARMTRSAAAMVWGYQHFEPDTPIAGVILNNVAHARHESRLRQAIESACGIPVIGALPRDERLTIPDRHLGLIPRGEDDDLLPALAACREAVQQHVNLEAALHIARAPLTPTPSPRRGEGVGGEGALPPSPPGRGVGGEGSIFGILRDRAFSFYYPENLEALQEAGARLVFIDALNDPALPSIDGLYIGGGFPELFMDVLSANQGLRQEVRRVVEAGLPVYAECGGLMYLSQGIHYQGRYAPMVGALPCQVEMTARPQGHGYVLARCDAPNPFFAQGEQMRGHEFHHSRLVNLDPAWKTAFALERGSGMGRLAARSEGFSRDGLVYHQVLAGYTHVHAAGAPTWAASLVARTSH